MNKKEFDFLGITQWHEAGYRGQGLRVVSRESEKSKHGKMVLDILKQILPEAEIICNKDVVDDLENIDGYTTSFFNEKDKYEKYIKASEELYKKNVFLTCAVGNDEYKALSQQRVWTSVGACILKDGEPKRIYYSATTEALDFMSLTNLQTDTGKFGGTSCANPVFFGMAMLAKQYIGKPTNEDLLKFIEINTVDLEDVGHDEFTGHGIFILPKVERIMEIKLRINSELACVNGEEVLLDTKPIIKNNRTLVPIRFIAETFGCDVEWDEKEKEITIIKG